MSTLNAKTVVLTPLVLGLLGTWIMSTAGEQAKGPEGATVPKLSTDRLTTLPPDELRVLEGVAKKIEATMSATASTQKVRDPDGRLGIFIDCAQPFLTPPNAPGMDVRKTWVLLAVFATVTSAEGDPVVIDYIGFTDAEGAHGKRWFYELNMSAARSIQKDIFTGAITMEQGYDKIIGAWRRVTRT